MSPTPLGGARGDALGRTLAKARSSLAAADAGTTEAFLDAWSQRLDLHARHMRHLHKSLNAPVFVIHVEDCGAVGSTLGWRRRSTLGASEADHLEGTVAIANDAVGGYVRTPACASASECEEVIRASGLALRPTVMLASTSKLLVWPSGIDGDQAPIERVFDSEPTVVDVAAIDAYLSEFYEQIARQNTDWWLDPKKRITRHRPEHRVQHDLNTFLIAKLSSAARVKKEDVSGSGRADITIWPRTNFGTSQSAVLELKTMRDCRTPNDPANTPIPLTRDHEVGWACEGVQQTAAYRDHEQMDAGFLCVYDFRGGNDATVAAEIGAAAAVYSVLSRRYWITASHEEHRTDRYPLPGDEPGD